MFVRWRRKKLVGRYGEEWVSLYAVLVKCERVNGTPRQTFARHLGRIRRNEKGYFGQRGFWERVERKLDELTLDATTRQRIEEKLVQTVKRPTPQKPEGRQIGIRELLSIQTKK